MPALGDPLPSLAAKDDPGGSGQPARDDQRHETQTVDAHPREPRGIRVEAGGPVQAPAGGGVLEQVPDGERHHGAIDNRPE